MDDLQKYNPARLDALGKNIPAIKRREFNKMKEHHTIEIADKIAQGISTELSLRIQDRLHELNTNLALERETKKHAQKKECVVNSVNDTDNIFNSLSKINNPLSRTLAEKMLHELDADYYEKIKSI